MAGCEREPLPALCPALAEGDLVVSEVSGAQTGGVPEQQWIELYNASGGELSLEGLHLVLQTLDGGSVGDILVRDPALTVAAGDYVVLGRAAVAAAPLDYGYLPDFDRSPFSTAAIDLYGCDGTLVDRAIYRDLPGQGTLSVSGAAAPSAAANEDAADWCVDATGSPGQANLECP